jgi:polysaccharide pyruvyl transferase WcaK-like protein
VGNLGDQAMLGGLTEILRSKGIGDIGIVTYAPENPWADVDGTHHAFALNGLLNNLLLIWRMSGYERFYYPGADVMDGAYSATMVQRVAHLLTMADGLGQEATVCGFSFNNDPDPLALQYITRLPPAVRLCCRDVPSQRRLQFRLKRRVELVADVAFNLLPDDSSETVQSVVAWIAQQRGNGRQIVGVNIHDQLARFQEGVASRDLWQKIANVLQELASCRQVAFVFIPHVYRSACSDLDVLRNLHSILDPGLQASTRLIDEKCSASNMKAISGYCDLVLSGRMHLAIASLGQGVPVICLTYQDKFEGLMEHFDLKGNTFSPQAVLQSEGLTARLLDYLDRCSELKQKVRDALPKVVEMSRANVR